LSSGNRAEQEEAVMDVEINEYGSLLRVKVTEDGMYLCPLCGARLATAKDLIAHILSHFSEERTLQRASRA